MQSIFAERLRSRRKELGLSQAQLAQKVGLSPSSISRCENDTGNPYMNFVVKMAECLEVSVDWLMGTDGIGTRSTEENPITDKSLIVDDELLPANYRADCCIIMNDDGMTGCGINKGDHVYISFNDRVRNKQIIFVKHRQKGYFLRRVFFSKKKLTCMQKIQRMMIL